MSQHRSRLFALLPAAVLVAFVAPIIAGARTWYLRDLFNYHLVAKATQARAMREGLLPLIDPFRAGGQALIGNLNNVALYPDNLLYLVTPAIWALNAHLWLHLLLAPVALYSLARAIGLERESAWCAGFCYALSGYFLSQLNLYNLVAGTALAPAFAAACIGAVSGKRPGEALAGGLRVAPAKPRPGLAAAAAGSLFGLLLVAGDPIIAASALLMGLLALLIERDFDRRRLARLALALGCGALLAAPQIVELVRLMPSSYRGGMGLVADSRLVASWDPRTAIELLVPLFFGPPDQRFWGELVLSRTRPLFFSLYPGLVAIALVAAAGRPRSARARWAWWMVLLGGFLALGGWNPIMFYLYRLPQASALRYPIKAWLLVAIGASLLAGMGFERAVLAGSRRSLLRPLGVLAAAAAVASIALVWWHRPAIDALGARITPALPRALAIEEVARWRGALLVSLGAVALAAVLVVASRRGPRLAGSALIALHVATQLLLLGPLLDTDAAAAYRAPPPALRYIEPTERIAHGCPISFACDLGRPGVYPDWRLSWVERRGWLELYAFAAAHYGLRYTYNVSPEGLDSLLVVAGQRAFQGLGDADALQLLAAASVDVVLLGRAVDDAALERVRLRARLPTVAGEVWIYEIVNRAPEARLATRVVSGDVRVVLRAMLDPSFDPRSDAFVPGRAAGSVERAGGSAVIESEGWDELLVRTESSDDGLLVLGRAWLPHYRARIDGRSIKTLQVGFGQLAVEVPAGAHRVEIRVDRRPFQAGLGAAALGAVVLGAMAWAGRRRDSVAAAAGQPPGAACQPSGRVGE